MSESSDVTIEILTIITNFLSSNSYTIAGVVLLFIFRDSVSGLLSRLTSLFYSKGNSKFGVEIAPPQETKKPISAQEEHLEKPDIDDEVENFQDKAKEQNWFLDMHKAFSEARFEDADAAFKKYAISEEDISKLEENKALYLYLRFEKAKDNSAIDDLERLSRSASSEETKVIALTWLSFCLSDSKQYKRVIDLWMSAKGEISSPLLLTKVSLSLAYALDDDGQTLKAKDELTQQLLKAETNEQLSLIYEGLSKIEESLGNKTISVYCKDKSLEFDPSNRDDLFSSAYAASQENVDEISLSNYQTLIAIDRDNATALNNLGVRAQESDLNIVAVENYKESSDLGNTLAMANQGYLLLGAGFVKEAEEIALKAIEEDETHPNVYSLLSAINKEKEEQKEKWKKLSAGALSRQKSIREYIEKYYVGENKLLEGVWLLKGKYKINIEVEKGVFRAAWTEEERGLWPSTYKVELDGKVSGSTFSGSYIRQKSDDMKPTLLGLPNIQAISCIGFVSDDEQTLYVVASRLEDDLFISLSRPSGT
jgi:tetratricopeptide (TPR) repeat protein